jgi:hypothetical protein
MPADLIERVPAIAEPRLAEGVALAFTFDDGPTGRNSSQPRCSMMLFFFLLDGRNNKGTLKPSIPLARASLIKTIDCILGICKGGV